MIVIGELQVIFLLHPVAIVIGVLRQLLVLIEQLRRVTARSAINPVRLIGATLIPIVVITTATAIVIITMVIQGILFPLTTNGSA